MQFTVETESTIVKNVKKRELIQQIESLQRFYYELGHDSDNIKTIFSLTLSYLKGHVNQLLVRSFFDVLMAQSRLKNGKELNLLNCFDSLIDEVESGGFKAQAEDTQLELSLREAA